MIGEILNTKTDVSLYQPSKEVSDFTALVKKEYGYGDEILRRPWEELNNYSVIDRDQKDRRTFNSYVDESVEDPAEAWKWRGTRSMARNRAMAMHAHLTAQYVVPMVIAQNEKQEDDREMGNVMRDILEWMTVNSGYRPSFLLATMGMLVSPVTYLGAEYCEVFQTIKEKQDDGTLSTKEILDEVLSGFQAPVYSVDQVLITNAYEQNIQRQRSIIERRYVEKSELEAKYGDHENWPFVLPGIRAIYNSDDGMFYDVKDEDHPYLVEEVTYKCRRDDIEVCFINGIYFGDSDVEANPIRHRDNRGAPKYNKIPFGYERIGEHYFYWKSMINRVGWDHQLMDAMYETTMNKAFLDLLPPLSISGEDKIDTSLVFPGAVTAFKNENTKVTPVLPPSNPAAGYNALNEIEKSMTEGSISDTQMGQLPEASQKAYSVAQAAQNAKTILAGVGKSLGESIAQFGQLMIDIALQHLTTAQVDEITDATTYRPFILHDQMVNGKKVSKKILFDESFMGTTMDDKQKEEYQLRLLTKIGYPDHAEHLYMVNPFLFSKMKYLVRIEPDMMEEKNKEFDKALSLQLYTTLRPDPMVEPEFLIRKVANSFYPQDGDDMINKSPQPVMPGTPAAPGAPAGAAPQPSNSAIPKQLSTALSGS